MEICRLFHVHALYVFGSAARGTMRDDSDVDMLVEFEPHAGIGFVAFSELQIGLEEIVGRKVDLVSVGGLNPIIRKQVLAEAILLHAA